MGIEKGNGKWESPKERLINKGVERVWANVPMR